MSNYIIIASVFFVVSILIYHAGIRAKNHLLSMVCLYVSTPAYVILYILGSALLGPSILIVVISKLLMGDLKDSMDQVLKLIKD